MSRILKFIVLFATVATVSHAALWVQTYDFGTFYPGNGLTPYTDTWSFDKFDEHNGEWTLNSIRMEFVLYAWDGFLGQDNDGTTSVSGQAGFNVTGDVDSPDVYLSTESRVTFDSTIVQQKTFTLSIDDDDGAGYQPGGDDWDSLSGPNESNKATAIVDGYIEDRNFVDYKGEGTFGMTFSGAQNQFFLTGPITSTVEPQQAAGYVRMTYDFIPEPMTMSLMGAGGLVALLANRMRRKSE